jgi:hypothetical protein
LSFFRLNKKKSLAIILLISIIVAVSVFVYMFTSRTGICGGSPKIENSVSYNSTDNTLLLQVKSWVNQTYLFDRIILKDSKSQILVTSNVASTELPAYKSVNITINLNSLVLNSGQRYSVELYTTEDDSFESYLTIYENVKTKVSLLSANTLLVDIQSFANQTIVFEKATINGWDSIKFDAAHTSMGMNSVDTTFSPQIKLLPNENASFTISYEKGFSYGNYSLILHCSSPQYVDGAWKFFIVTGMEDCFNRVANIEKIAFDDADNSTLLVDIKSLSEETIVISGVTVKESNGYIYAVIASGNPVPAEVLPYESVTISVSLKIHQSLYAKEIVSFGSGNYIVTLNCGSNAVWAPLAVP